MQRLFPRRPPQDSSGFFFALFDLAAWESPRRQPIATLDDEKGSGKMIIDKGNNDQLHEASIII